MADVAWQLYQSQRTALGVVAVQLNDGLFNYEIFRSTEPEEYEVAAFFDEHHGDSTRFIIHGRLATSGERDNEGTHPIELNCPECDIDYVLHNGVIGPIHHEKSHMEVMGHEWTTNVDTELIAHDFGAVPDEADFAKEVLGDSHYLQRQNAFILLNSERIYIYTPDRSKYSLTTDGELFCRYRDFGFGADDTVTHFILRAPGRKQEVLA